MVVRWRKETGKSLYYYGETDTRFSAQIGVSTSGGFAWMIFHADFTGCFHGGSSPTVEEAMDEVSQYLTTFARPQRSP